MKELFQWVPWFEELARKVGEGRRESLVERAKKVDWAGKKCAVLEQGEDKADPLTFFYHLASIAGGKTEKRRTIYASVSEVFGIENELDYSVDDCFIFPIPPALQVQFNNTGADPQLLWRMYDQACALNGTAYDVDITDTFAKMLNIRGVGIPKLTQVLFLINPRAFLPFDNKSVLSLGIGKSKKKPTKISWSEYLDEMKKIQTTFSGCQCYEINIISYLWSSGRLPRKDNHWYQINTPEERWADFRDNNWVYYGKPGDETWTAEGDLLPRLQRDFPLDKPAPGDVIFVHSGKKEGYGICIVYRNNYHESLHANGRIHVLWVNKKQVPLIINMPVAHFSRVGIDYYEAFANTPAYSAISDLLPPPRTDADQWYQERFGTARVWMLRASAKHWDAFQEREIIAIGWGELGNLLEFDNKEDIYEQLRKSTDAPNPIINSLACYQFAHVVQPGDHVIAMRGGNLLLGYGVIKSEYTFDENRPEFRHVRDVTWEKIGRWPVPETRTITTKTFTDFSPYKQWLMFAFEKIIDLPDPPLPPGDYKLNQILYGPPGTGKTYSTTARAMAIVKGIKVDDVTEEHRNEFRDLRFDSKEETGQITMVTFHQNYSYEDFVEGIRPRLAGDGDLDYELRPGVFRKIVKAALDNPDRPYILIIDEINRGNIPKILGELITLIEPSRRLGQDNETEVMLPYSGDRFGVPGNLYIIGTMNTADRSILPLDIALRRRFDHVEMMPNPDHPLISDNVDGINLRKMLKAINARISLLLDRERQIGHTYLFNVDNVKSLANKFKTAILPLLLEYFYDDWAKVRKVLGGATFVVVKEDGEHLGGLVAEGLLDPDTDTFERLPGTAEEWLDPGQYRLIYKKNDAVA